MFTGWAWYLKLQQELATLSGGGFGDWSANTKLLADHLVKSYKTFLPKLAYPIRVGEHSNTAFGLIFALDYANCKNITVQSAAIN